MQVRIPGLPKGLVLSRAVGQAIVVYDAHGAEAARLTFIELRTNGQVRIHIAAPPTNKILRDELVVASSAVPVERSVSHAANAK